MLEDKGEERIHIPLDSDIIAPTIAGTIQDINSDYTVGSLFYIHSEVITPIIKSYEKEVKDHVLNVAYQFEIPVFLKEFLLGIRDVNLQARKAQFKYKEGKISAENASSFNVNLQRSVKIAADKTCEKIIYALKTSNVIDGNSPFKNINSPASTYIQQYTGIAQQITSIEEEYDKLDGMKRQVDVLHAMVVEVLKTDDLTIGEINKVLMEMKALSSEKDLSPKETRVKFASLNSKIQQLFPIRSNLDFQIEENIIPEVKNSA